ncbi:hypothetical protein PR202_ga19676 [Eleusine coracana subsp. coracana]|uniref:Protein kinase domain-containing protein n=1 Tax=Eleusine coracana subsp. coracana TaxID=191504 RepID=A0AAV5CWQ2_ELECO|nr:hypothetical protein PR202_ga19676 [Eleusine coracana subsp. coracana]
MEKEGFGFNATNTPYLFSDVQNKYTVIGCDALAYISDSNGMGYESGCVSKCRRLSDVTEGSCSGIGCCQTAIPKGMNFYKPDFDIGFNTTKIWRFNRCNYAVLMETTTFNFSSTYINTTKFNDTSAGRVPVVIDWAIRNGGTSCEIAKRNEMGTYACISSNSECVDSMNGPGYFCNCSKGYDGNPYLPNGCKETELVQATNNYDKSRILGKGGQGTVYKGLVKDNMHVAIKRCVLVDERKKKEFGQEMLILSQINHKNIVKLFGACLEAEVPMLVYEFIPNGTLHELIHGKKQALRISFSTLLRIAHEAAEGLNFLHSYASPPIHHGDVKSANILLDENYTAKVSDFGASILVPSDEDQYVTVVQGTRGYLDPEYMQTFQLTNKSDVIALVLSFWRSSPVRCR